MDKELQDGGEREDTWAGEGAEALARDLLVDGETGESFPAQVLLPPTLVSALPAPRHTRLELFQKTCSGGELCLCGGPDCVWRGVYKGTVAGYGSGEGRSNGLRSTRSWQYTLQTGKVSSILGHFCHPSCCP